MGPACGASGGLGCADRPTGIGSHEERGLSVKRWLVGALVTVLFLGAGGWAVVAYMGGSDAMKGGWSKPKEPTRVLSVEVAKGDLIRRVSAPGTVEPDVRVKVGAQVSAKVLALPKREGQDVKVGDVVCRLDAEDLQARLDASRSRLRGQEASLESAMASLRLAEVELGRVRELASTNDVARSVLDEAEARFEQARASVAMAQSGIDAARADVVERERDVSNTVITSPIDGTVVRVNTEVGEQVLGTFNNQGSVILEIADLSTMLVRARIDEANVAQVREGQDVTVFLNAYRERTFQGRVKLVKLEREIYRDGTAFVEAEVSLNLAEGDRFATGLASNVDIHAQTLLDVVKVPTQAILDVRVDELAEAVVNASAHVDRTKTFCSVVFVMKDGKAEHRPVSLGPSDTTHTVVLAGLDPGDRLIVGPYKTLIGLKHGEAVAERGEEEASDTASKQPDEGGRSGRPRRERS